MAKVEQLPTIQVEARFILNEDEMSALNALAGYGPDAFLEVFYKELGSTYLKPHEKGLRTLFDVARGRIPTILNRAKKAREAFRETCHGERQ